MKKQHNQVKQVLNKQAQLGLIISAALLAPSIALASGVDHLPYQPHTISGSAHYQHYGTTIHSGQAANVNKVTQNASKLITDWTGFNIGRGLTVDVVQDPGMSALFRVIGNTKSEIFGTLNAGNLFLVNPNGVLFGGSAQVNVGNFVASTMDIKNKNFLDGKYKFTAKQGSNNAYNDVINQGFIKSKGGYVVLLSGNQVVNGQNSKGPAEIKTEGGSVVMAASTKATLVFDNEGLVTAKLSGDQLENVIVRNTGNINAKSGSVQLATNARSATVNVNGLIEASNLKKGADGIIRLQAGQGGNVYVSGKLLNKGSNKKTSGNKIIMTAGNNIAIKDTAKINLGKDKGFSAKAGNGVVIGSQIKTSGDGAITIVADNDKSGVGNVKLNANLKAEEGAIKIAGVNINDLPPTGAGPAVTKKKPTEQSIKTVGSANGTSGKIAITATGNVNLQNTDIETIGGTSKKGNQKGGDAGKIEIAAGDNALLREVVSEGGNGVSNNIKPKNMDNVPNGGHAGNITIVAGNNVRFEHVGSYGGHAAGASTQRFNPYIEQGVVRSVQQPEAVFGGKGGYAGNINIAAGNNVNGGVVVSEGGNGGIGQGVQQAPIPTTCPPHCPPGFPGVPGGFAPKTLPVADAAPEVVANKADGGKGGNVNISAGNNILLNGGAGSIGGQGGGEGYAQAGRVAARTAIKETPSAKGGNAGDVNIKAGGNAVLGLGAGSLGGKGGSNAKGGNAGDVSVEAGGRIAAIALLSQGGQPDMYGNASKGSDAGDIKVASTGAGDINIGVIAANSGDEVGSKFGKWGKGKAAKPGSVTVSNADGDISILYIDTQGGVNADGGDVTITGANDISLGSAQNIQPLVGFVMQNGMMPARHQQVVDARGGINTNGGWANLGIAGVPNQQSEITSFGTPGNNAGNIDVTANGNLVVGKITANGSDASGYFPIFQLEQDAVEYAAQATKLNGGDGGTVTLRYGDTVSFFDAPEVVAERQANFDSAPFELLVRPSLPIIKNPNPMDGPNGPIADVPEGQITAFGGRPNWYGVFETPEGEGGVDARQSRLAPSIGLRPLGAFGTPGQISILKLVDPVVVPPAVTIPTVEVVSVAGTPVSVPLIIPNPRDDAAFGGFIAGLPEVLAVNVENVGATAAGGEDGEGCEASGSSNPNATTVLNFGPSLPGGVDPEC